jgi:hypothetical protein
MIIEDGILDFLDGNLAPREEEELLHRLAVSPERRALLKQHLQVRELTSTLARKNRYNVPKAVTASLFETLSANGYAGPIFHTSNENAEMLRASLEKNLDRAAHNVTTKRSKSTIFFSSVFSFVTGALLMYFFLPGLTAKTVDTQMAEKVSGNSNANEITLSANNINSVQNGSSSTDFQRMEEVSPNHSSNAALTDTRNVNKDIDNSYVSREFVASSAHNVSNAANSIEVTPTVLEFAPYSTNIDLGSANAYSINTSNSIPFENSTDLKNIPASSVNNSFVEAVINNDVVPNLEKDVVAATTKVWYDNGGMRSGSISDINSKGYFGRDPEDVMHSSILDRTTLGLRTGIGTSPEANGISGSLIEFKLSADLSDWLVAKLSYGQFMPYETEAQNAGKNSDGVRQIELVPVLQSKSVVSAELGIRFDVIGAPIELMGGMMTDMKNGVIPRASIFSHFELFENVDLGMGVEGMLYTNDISSSVADKQNLFSYEHPVMTSTPKSKETSGFIGPAIELMWHF